MLVILMCLISIVGCQNKYRKHISLDSAICASYAVPGMYCDDLKGGAFSYEIIEEDSYGRILYRFETINCLTEKEETVYVICQKTVSKYVYFYEDICYLFEENDNDDLMALKERNDWESELNTEKMWFEIREDGEIVKSVMKDHKIIQVPITDATDYKELIFSGVTLIIAGVGLIILSKKKNKGDSDEKK